MSERNPAEYPKHIMETDSTENILAANIDTRKQDQEGAISDYNRTGRVTGNGALDIEDEVTSGTATYIDPNSAWGPVTINVEKGK